MESEKTDLAQNGFFAFQNGFSLFSTTVFRFCRFPATVLSVFSVISVSSHFEPESEKTDLYKTFFWFPKRFFAFGKTVFSVFSLVGLGFVVFRFSATRFLGHTGFPAYRVFGFSVFSISAAKCKNGFLGCLGFSVFALSGQIGFPKRLSVFYRLSAYRFFRFSAFLRFSN